MNVDMNEKICSVLAIGQSNMAGRGHLWEVERIRNERCFMLRMGRWQPMLDPVNADRPTSLPQGEFQSGVGPQSAFADMLSRDTGKRVGMIPCADGGTRLCQWMPGEILYDHAVMQAKLAMRSSEFSGIIWHQGESDCPEPHVDAYREDLISMLTSMRKELCAEKLPIVLGELTEKATPRWNMPVDVVHDMNQAIRDAAEAMKNAAVVPVNDLEIQEDGIHFSAASQYILGRRYAEAFEKLMKS